MNERCSAAYFLSVKLGYAARDGCLTTRLDNGGRPLGSPPASRLEARNLLIRAQLNFAFDIFFSSQYWLNQTSTANGAQNRSGGMTVRETIRRQGANLTVSERKIGDAVLADYPFGALQTIQELAERTGVSAPSITRFVSKIGFAGYQEFQRQLIAELRESRSSPLELKATEKLGSANTFLADYAQRAAERMHEMSGNVPQEQFDRVLALVADPARTIFVLGGRVSDSIARFLSVNLKQIRPKVHHLPPNPEHWPDLLLSLRRQDVLILFDFRRYQRDLESLADIVARECRPFIVLITDKWLSPIARHSDHVIALPIEIETAWDTLVCALAFVEALIVKVSETNWPTTKERLEAWDRLRLVSPGNPLGDKDDR